MHLLQAVLMGIVQGLSEFLPISSSAHLVFSSNFYKICKNIDLSNNSGQEVILDIMLHLGTLIAVLIFFKEDIIKIIQATKNGFKTKNFENKDFKIGIYIILGTIITALVAVPLSEISEKLVFMPAITGLLLIITGLLLLFSEWYSKKNIGNGKITLKTALITGFAQGLSSIPGFSRSGFTIAAALFSGTDRVSAAKYSFLLSIPIILGASMIYPLINIDFNNITSYNWNYIIIGTVVSGVVGYFCIKYFLKFLQKFSLVFFGYYCVLMGIFAYIFFTGKV